ncbi:ComEC/Rec2 family competence protein [Rhizobium daejeonense]|nr:ComEC/Rec2 family competence protein [Rhizobium daejeonense]
MGQVAKHESVNEQAYGRLAQPLMVVEENYPLALPPRPTRNAALQLAEGSARLLRAGRTALAGEEAHGHLFHFVPVFLGVGAVTWFSMAEPPGAIALFIMFGVLATVAWVVRYGRLFVAFGAFATTLFVAGMMLANAEAWREGTIILDTPVTTVVSGIVERREAGSRGEWRYVVRVTSTRDPQIRRPPERVSLLARGKHEPAPIGGYLSGRARLSPPSGPALPGLNDFAFASYFDGVGAVGFFLGPPQSQSRPYEGGAETWGLRFDRTLFSLRDDISTRIRSVIPGDPGAFAASIITGERRSMSKEATEALRLSGLAHITAISGLNMALAAGIFFVGLRKLLSLLPGLAHAVSIKKLAATGALVGAFTYLLISGYQVSAVRAFLMTAIMLMAVLFDRPAISLRNLALAAIVIVAVTPSAIMGPSFQMSFAATAALIAGYAAWRDRPARRWIPDFDFPGANALRWSWGVIAGTIMTSLIGGLSTAVFAIAHFHRLAPHSLEANLAAMPLISLIIMPAGLVAMLLMPFGLDTPFLVSMGVGLEWVLVIAREVSAWGEGVGFLQPPAWFLPVASLGLLFLTLLSSIWRHVGSLLLVIAGSALFSGATGVERADVLVSEDGRLVGLLKPPAIVATNRARPPSFIYDQWTAALQLKTHIAPDEIAVTAPQKTADGGRVKRTPVEVDTSVERMRQALADIEIGRFICESKTWCMARLTNGWIVATVEDGALVGKACDIADLVISERRTNFPGCLSGAVLMTAETLRRSGAIELRLGDRATRQFAVEASFSGPPRPWSQHRYYDWRSGKFQMASTPFTPGQNSPVVTSGGGTVSEMQPEATISDNGE